MRKRRRVELSAIAALALAVAGTATAQENIDPGNTGAQYAYSANAGWWNAEPSGDGGPGVAVSDAALTGYVWAGNLGWVSLSCQNTASCGTASYGVTNDGHGHLSGLAYAQNVGWVDFRPKQGGTPVAGAGVDIDPSTGVFSGTAYGANIGWIRLGTFATPGVAQSQIQTGWREATPTRTPSATATGTPTGAAGSGTATRSPTATASRTPGLTPV